MTEEKRPEQHESGSEDREKNPETGLQKDATDEEVAREEESGGALPSNHSDED